MVDNLAIALDANIGHPNREVKNCLPNSSPVYIRAHRNNSFMKIKNRSHLKKEKHLNI